MCCHRDLEQINDNNINNIKDALDCDIDVDVWETKIDALNEIVKWYDDIDDIKEVKKMIDIEKRL